MSNPFRRHLPWLVILAALSAAVTFTPPAWAGGSQHYPNGVTDFLAGVLPPPGFYWLNYLGYIHKDSLRDNDGDKQMFGPNKSDFDANVFVEVPRFVYMSSKKILGATWGAQIFFPFYYADAELKVGGVKAFDSSRGGLGDIIFSPCILAWHLSPNLHMGASIMDIWAPTGNYDKDEPATQILSKNLWTFEPVYAVSYWVPGGVDISAKFMYDFNTKNNDYVDPADGQTKTLKPGQEFHFDWGASYALGKEDYRLGLSGYYYVQTTDDKLDGDKVPDNRSRLVGIGPTFKWWPGMGKLNVTAKYLEEFAGKNIAQGRSFWINSTWVF